MESNSIDVQLTAEDYLSANYLHMRWTRLLAVLLLGALAFSIMPLFEGEPMQLSFDALEPMMIFVVFFGVAMFVIRYLYTPWKTRRIYSQQKSLRRPQHMTWNEDWLAVQGEGFSAQSPWTDYMRWRESKTVFSVYLSDVAFRIVPKRAFVDEKAVADFRDLLRRKVAPKEGQKRKKS